MRKAVDSKDQKIKQMESAAQAMQSQIQELNNILTKVSSSEGTFQQKYNDLQQKFIEADNYIVTLKSSLQSTQQELVVTKEYVKEL